MKRTLIAAILFSAFAALAPLGAVAHGGPGHHAPPTASVVAAFNASVGQLPESLTTDRDGNFYFSMANTIQKLTPDGQLSLYAQLPIPAGAFALGVKFGPDGDLYAGSGSFDPSHDAANLFRISPAGAVTTLAHFNANTFANDFVFDAAGNAYVTDPFLGKIWKVTSAGALSTWLENPLLAGNPTAPALIFHPFGADGIAFDQRKKNLYIGNLDAGAIVKVPVNADGSAGTPGNWVVDARLKACDGLAFDAEGNLYVAVNGQNQVAKIDSRRRVSIVASGPVLDAPSSLVFGQRHASRKTLYIANFAINRALGTQPGTPQPGLLKLPVGEPGLAIP